jgi:predicted dehydrogenase
MRMKIAVLGSSGHWRLATDGIVPGRGGLEWRVSPVDAGEDPFPVMQALGAAGQRTRLVPNWLDALDGERPDVAVVNPPFHLLGSVVRECLERGIHVFAEKPLAIEAAELAAIRSLAAAPGAPKLMAMLSMRYDPEFLAGYRFAETGALGTPVLLTARKSYPLMGWDGKPRPAFYHKRSTYGGTIPWIGIHAVDLFRWFAGSPFTRVRASHTTLGNGGHGEMESAATMEFGFASGALASAQLDFLRRRTDGDPWGDNRLRVAGTEGVLEIRDGKAFARTATEEFRELAVERAAEPGAMFSAFLGWVEGETPMLLSTEDCLAASEASLRARDAADQSRTLAL